MGVRTKLLSLVFSAVALLAAAGVSYGQGYVIGEEDRIQISVWGNPDLTVAVPVKPDGMISMHLVGDIKAAGLTTQELKAQIGGMWYLDMLRRKGLIDEAMLRAAYVDNLTWAFGHVSRGMTSPSGNATRTSGNRYGIIFVESTALDLLDPDRIQALAEDMRVVQLGRLHHLGRAGYCRPGWFAGPALGGLESHLVHLYFARQRAWRSTEDRG